MHSINTLLAFVFLKRHLFNLNFPYILYMLNKDELLLKDISELEDIAASIGAEYRTEELAKQRTVENAMKGRQ